MLKRIICLVCATAIVWMLAGCGRLDDLAEHAKGLKESNPPTADEEYTESDLVGDVTFPPEAQKAGWVFKDFGDVANLTADYEDVTLAQTVAFLQSLEKEGYYLTDHYAYNGKLDAYIDYSLDTRSLEAIFTLVKGSTEWPKGTLTPYLAYVTTPFPYGTYAGCETADSGKAFTLKYEDTSIEELMNYLGTLQVMGYVTEDGETLTDTTSYVSYSYDYSKKTAYLTVGLRDIQMVPLPPWPEPIPEQLRRILPPVAAVMAVTGTEDGFFARAEQNSLAELYGFVSSAPGYGWSAPDDQNEMYHEETGYALRFLSYDTQSDVMTLTIWNTEGGAPVTTGPDVSAQASQVQQTVQPSQTEENGRPSGQTEGGYRYALTQGKYGESQVGAAIVAEYGKDAELADFLELKALFGNDFPAFLDRLGVQTHEDIWVMYFGDEYFADQRHYFMERMSGTSRDDFLIHDRVGDEAWLGSWYGMQLRALVKMPE